MTIVDDGRLSGTAVVRFTGSDGGMTLVDSLIPTVRTGLEVTLDYVLTPDAKYVEIVTTVHNPAEIAKSAALGVLAQFGHRLRKFYDGCGRGPGVLDDPGGDPVARRARPGGLLQPVVALAGGALSAVRRGGAAPAVRGQLPHRARRGTSRWFSTWRWARGRSTRSSRRWPRCATTSPGSRSRCRSRWATSSASRRAPRSRSGLRERPRGPGRRRRRRAPTAAPCCTSRRGPGTSSSRSPALGTSCSQTSSWASPLPSPSR